MFRDLKEYQEIKKLYSEKVSKPEKLEENRNTRGSELAAKRLADKPKTREEVGLKPIEKKPFVGSRSRFNTKKTEVKKEPEYKPVKGVVFGQRTNEVGAKGGGKPSEGDFKKDFPDKKPEISKLTKQGKPRTKAQMMAAKRIGSGTAKNPDTTIAQVKQSNEDSMRAKAKERHAAFKAKREARRLARMNKEEFTPYDIVLEYLLSSQQAATIEEANYIMTEMDAKTIQDIVS